MINKNKLFPAFIFVLLILLIALPGCSTTEEQSVNDQQPSLNTMNLTQTDYHNAAIVLDQMILRYSLPEKARLLFSRQGDFTGDGLTSRLLIFGELEQSSSLFMDRIYFILDMGDNGITPWIRVDLPDSSNGGYNARVGIGDFDYNGVDDIFIGSSTGGSGGYVNYHILTFYNKEANFLLTPPQDAVIIPDSVAFIPGFQFEIIIQGREPIIWDLSQRRDSYVQNGLYSSGGQLLQNTGPNVGYYGLLYPLDIDNDGVWELTGSQSVKGVTNSDVVGLIKSVWRFNIVDNSWQLVDIQANPNL